MTRKDYVLIARAIREQADQLTDPQDAAIVTFGVYAVALRLADALAEDNEWFNREKFLDAALGGLRV